MSFPTKYDDILSLLDSIDPINYGSTRNYIDGSVTRLSPYISRGVLSTKQVHEHLLNKGFEPKKIWKLVQELAWRDYWQLVWIEKGNAINSDLKRVQSPVLHYDMVTSIEKAETGIHAIDAGIKELYETGYMHNHLRMYTASLCCNMAYAHWKSPAKWLYYHLLDGDWASNALSWQWVSGANANKKYVANQENINNFCYTNQENTFLDIEYEQFTFPSYESKPEQPSPPTPSDFKPPEILLESNEIDLKTVLPDGDDLNINQELPTYIYNWYNLDPTWDKDQKANRVLLLEPSVFKAYPISIISVEFMLELGKNIPNLQVFVGEFSELKALTQPSEIKYKEHPLNNYSGSEHPRDWMFSVKGFYSSFFGFWKKAKKEMPY